jgi:hypothetical protein
MKYPDFKTAALRHKESCHVLMSVLGASKSSKNLRLLWNIYYLSGYIVECSLKFAFFKSIRYERTREIEDLDYTAGTKTYTFEKILKQKHDLSNIKNEFLQVLSPRLPSGIPFVNSSVSDEYGRLLKKWDAQIRYSDSYALLGFVLEQQLLQQYLETVIEPIFIELTKE